MEPACPIREVLGFDIEERARNGVYMVLSSYSLLFLRSLKKGDEFMVTCAVYKDKKGLPKLRFKQSMLLNKKIMAKAVFTGICAHATGRRQYLPDNVLICLNDVPELTGQN